MRSRPDAAGVFTGHAMSGRLKAVLSAPLTISVLSWNLFGAGDPSLVLMKSGGAIVKGAAEPGAPADYYAVRSLFEVQDGPARGAQARIRLAALPHQSALHNDSAAAGSIIRAPSPARARRRRRAPTP